MHEIVPIFSGGGTRLPAYIGVLSGLQELDIRFDQMVGVSGGSIISALYCSGRPLEDIYQLAMKTDFRQFKEFSLISLLRDGGLSSGDRFEKWMDQQLDGARFKDLKLDLNVLATDVNGGGPVLFNKEQTPELKVSKAVRFSMSIPLIFSFKKFNEHLLVDGAILSEDALFRDWSSNKIPTICFRLKGQQVKRDITKTWFPLPQYIMLLIRTFMTTISREYVPAGYWHNTILVDSGPISAVDFDLTEQQKHGLYQKGKSTVIDILPIKLQNIDH